MSSTSKKHKDFLKKPMGDKSVRTLPGIDRKYGRKLEENGFDKAYLVFAVFLFFKKNGKKFKNWLEDICKPSSRHYRYMDACYQCLKEYCEIYV